MSIVRRDVRRPVRNDDNETHSRGKGDKKEKSQLSQSENFKQPFIESSQQVLQCFEQKMTRFKMRI